MSYPILDEFYESEIMSSLSELRSSVLPIESEETSEEVVTIVEVQMSRQRKAFILTNKLRSIQKNVAADSLEQLIQQGRDIFSYQDEDEVYIVLEEDGTEVDDEEYFQTLPEFTVLMLLDNLKEIWAPTLGDFENEPRGTLSARKLAKALLEHIRNSRHEGMKESCTAYCLGEDDFPVTIHCGVDDIIEP